MMYIERDSRRQALGKVEHPGQLEYLSICLDHLISALLEVIPKINSKYYGLEISVILFRGLCLFCLIINKFTVFNIMTLIIIILLNYY